MQRLQQRSVLVGGSPGKAEAIAGPTSPQADAARPYRVGDVLILGAPARRVRRRPENGPEKPAAAVS